MKASRSECIIVYNSPLGISSNVVLDKPIFREQFQSNRKSYLLIHKVNNL